MTKLEMIDWTLECLPEDTPIRGNLIDSGDNYYDRERENEAIARFEYGNYWQWCMVKVTGRFLGLKASEYLGCVNYDDEASFRADGQYDDMRSTILDQIIKKIDNIIIFAASEILTTV